MGSGSSYEESEIDYLNNQLNSNFSVVDFNVKDAVSIIKKGFPVFVQSIGEHSCETYKEIIGHSYLIDYAETIDLSYFEVYALEDNEQDPSIEEPDSGLYGPDLNFYREIYGDIYSSFINSTTECWVSMNWGWGGKYDDVCFYVLDGEWVVKDNADSYCFNSNRIYRTL